MAKTKNNIKYWIRICEIEWNFHEKKIKHLVTIQQVEFSQNRSIQKGATREIKREEKTGKELFEFYLFIFDSCKR